MFKPHNYAYQIEVTVNAMFKSGKYGMGGIADANFIEKNPFIAIALVLGNFYNKIIIKKPAYRSEYVLEYANRGHRKMSGQDGKQSVPLPPCHLPPTLATLAT